MPDLTTRPANLLAVFQGMVARAPEQVLLRDPDAGTTWSRKDLEAQSRSVASALSEYGLEGHTAGLLMGNRAEFFLCDLALLWLGATPVSLYPTSSAAQLAHYIIDADLRMLFVEASKVGVVLQALSLANRRLPVVVVDPEGGGPGESPMLRLVDLQRAAEGVAFPGERTGPDALATIIYTSGTTGKPKGVCLTQGNVLSAVEALEATIGFKEGWRVISWLPHAHVAERTCHYYGTLMWGLEVTFCRDATLLPSVLREVRPDWFGAVPRFWEKVRLQLETKLRSLPSGDAANIRRAMANRRMLLRAQSPSAPLGLLLSEEDVRYLQPFRAAIGLDRAHSVLTGSAPTPLPVQEFFAGLGLPLMQMYGATETCTCATIETMNAARLGSVGRPMRDMSIRVGEDGEIFVRGPNVMQGYLGQPEATTAAVDEDGWYASGDLGKVDADGFLWVTGRKKDVIINAGGHNMSPQSIEAVLAEESALIAHAVVIGDALPYNTALLVVDEERWAARAAIESEEQLRCVLTKAIAVANEKLARVEQIKRFRILRGPWLPGTDELTATMKVRRAAIVTKYAREIDELYADMPGAECFEPLPRAALERPLSAA